MLTKDQMIEIAQKYISPEEAEIKCVILKDLIIEKSYGLIFEYQSKDFIESGNFSDSLLGNAPFLVKNENGQIVVFGTNEPLEDYIEAYESGVWDPEYTVDDFMV